MSVPPFLAGAGILFWGWQTGLWVPAGIAAAVLEGHRFTSVRWALSSSDYRRIAGVCNVLLLGFLAFFAVTRGFPHAVVPIIQWLPAAVFPLAAAQVYGESGRVALTDLFVLKRRRADESGDGSGRRIDLLWPFVALCLLAASAANVRTPGFFVGMLVLTVWALWPVRSRRFPVLLWGALVVVAGAGGYAGGIGLNSLQKWLVEHTADWLGGGGSTDPYKSVTDIGHIGELKLSDRILLRARGPDPSGEPFLLHRASYDTYGSPSWLARNPQFETLRRGSQGHRWKLGAAGQTLEMTVFDELRRGTAVLSLPAGTVEVDGPNFDSLSRNRFGVLKAAGRPGTARYTIRYLPGAAQASPPTDDDRRIPPTYAAVFERLAQDLGLSREHPEPAMEAVDAFFAQHFSYSLYQRERDFDGPPLLDFLQRARHGHCEYFATATVMLLRAAGIPARYATGFSVQEYSAWERAWVVRQRHAHAWARVWVDGAWRDLDTTPAQWLAVETAEASVWEPVLDVFSWLLFRITEWRSAWHLEAVSPGWLGAIVLLFLWLGWRLRKRWRRRIRPVESASAPVKMGPRTGSDSEYYRIEARLAEVGLPRRPGEPPLAWAKRVAEQYPEPRGIRPLAAIIGAHYRYRFHPRGVSAAERLALKKAVGDWLATSEQVRVGAAASST